jgi:hypothetical protein
MEITHLTHGLAWSIGVKSLKMYLCTKYISVGLRLKPLKDFALNKGLSEGFKIESEIVKAYEGLKPQVTCYVPCQVLIKFFGGGKKASGASGW